MSKNFLNFKVDETIQYTLCKIQFTHKTKNESSPRHGASENNSSKDPVIQKDLKEKADVEDSGCKIGSPKCE